MNRQRALTDGAVEINAGVLAKPSLLGGVCNGSEPLWALRAKGAHIWDQQERCYLDLMMGFGSVILGHADPVVTDAVIEDIRGGISPTLRKVKEQDLAELLASVVPNAEMVMFLKTGSDATSAAVRVARAYTGRSVVLRWGYQGWHDWCAPRGSGIPTVYRDLTENLPFNDIESLRKAFAQNKGEVAAVIVMVADSEVLDREYLLEVRRLADLHGSLFILDEVRTGFRLALGGAQEYFNIDADLVAISKAMANGHPMAALTGRREVMRTVADVSMSSVFFRSTDGISAAIATVQSLQSTDAISVVWERGRQLQEGMIDGAAKAGLPVHVIGLPPMPFHRFELTGTSLVRALDVFYETTWKEGLLLHRDHHWFTCAAMSVADIERAISIIGMGYQAVANAL
ncbi:aminotransferase class III-fold pyridoxal phosphate-dependent enzyme [Rhodococcus sp. 05-2255-3C]|uniref:aminotransferase class III-fold pyridoxal phosphate-dependent enzyme n=1 Tax=Rhodococcus sp. 05-2255-3C TaxID=2022483 RepID=UPI0015C65AB6|nr:aminotransferase class III-fold pyridoxal phosphate-dependent enzyme [Rhodococcus sp. 05-2255-3C]